MKTDKFTGLNISTAAVVKAGMIASVYIVLILLFAPLSFGPIQVRIAEALTLLPYLWAEAVPGLFIGCVLSNFIGGFGIIDAVLGGAATLAAAILTRRMPNLFLAAVPPVVINMLVVGGYLSWILDLPFIVTALYIGIGQSIACFVLGIPLTAFLRSKIKKRDGR